MSSTAENLDADMRASRVWFEEDFICIALMNGRQVKTPLSFYPRLANATPEQRLKFQLSGSGKGVHWPELDEDLTVKGIALGRKAAF